MRDFHKISITNQTIFNKKRSKSLYEEIVILVVGASFAKYKRKWKKIIFHVIKEAGHQTK